MQSKELLRQIATQRAEDCVMATLVEDISSLKVLFQHSSFCLVQEESNGIGNKISSDALDTDQDEEWLNS